MATITMDTSEYEAMKKVEKLLEASVENERKLAEEIKQLNTEKIKILEEASMKVVKISKIETREHLLFKVDKRILQSKFEDIRVLLNRPIERGWSDRESRNYEMITNILESCYDKPVTTGFPVTTIETHGLDEVKKEIREDLEKELSDEVKRKMQIADTAFETITKLKQENKELITNQSKLILELDSTSKEKDLLEKKVDELVDGNVKVSKVINTFLEDFEKGIGYFEAKSYLCKFKEFVIKTLYSDDTNKR